MVDLLYYRNLWPFGTNPLLNLRFGGTTYLPTVDALGRTEGELAALIYMVLGWGLTHPMIEGHVQRDIIKNMYADLSPGAMATYGPLVGDDKLRNWSVQELAAIYEIVTEETENLC